MARPKKYVTQQQRKNAIKQSLKKSKAKTQSPIIKGKFFRLVIPNLQQFKDQSQDLIKLKGDTLMLILQKQKSYGLQFYKIAIQTHITTGIPHLDILLLYDRSVQKSLRRFDYLIKPGHLTKYKTLNAAILQYGDKQDLYALTNMPKDSTLIIKKQQIQQEPYQLLHDQMVKDPFHFNAIFWLKQSNLLTAMSKLSWSKHFSLLRQDQQDQCNKILHDKFGFRLITKDLIRQVLTSSEYRKYTKNVEIYGIIVDKINEIVKHGFTRPFKTKQLLLVGKPDIGKSTLALEIQKHVSVYYKGVSNWFPHYQSNIYKMILWDQFNLRSMPYPQLLKFLQGLKMDLQYKGGSVLKTDNQLIYMTSNMSLQQHICMRFSSQNNRAHARANLRARIEEVILPDGVDLFLLCKLICSG